MPDATSRAPPIESCAWPQSQPIEPDDIRDTHLRSLMKVLWHSREDGDFRFEIHGDSIRAHRCIVTSASPVFKAMLASEMAENLNASVSIDAESEDIMSMLKFMYLGILDASPQHLPGVLQLAHKYEIDNLIVLCCSEIVKRLDAETVVPFVHVLRLLEGTPVKLPRVVPNFGIFGVPPQPVFHFDEDPDLTDISDLTQAAPCARPLEREESTASEFTARASPIAHTFFIVAKMIASNPHLQMLALRGV